MLTMSDLQLLTGLSILISGYTQLRCGLSAYHWQKIVNLAWFTSTTHLSCLTFLRNYLSQRKAQRIWRVLAMGTLVLLLLVAIVRTRYFIFEYRDPPCPNVLRPTPSDYAICYFTHAGLPPADMTSPSLERQRFEEACFDRRHDLLDTKLQYVVISVVLLGLGMLVRILRLHEGPSELFLCVRGYISQRENKLLDRLRAWCDTASALPGLRYSLCYRPVLALAINLRSLLDFALSIAFEVSSFPFLLPCWCYVFEFTTLINERRCIGSYRASYGDS